MSYQPLVYKKQGGSELVVASGGTVTVESGGVLQMGTAAVAANGDTLTATAALHAGRVVQFGKTSGTVVTLPAATGTGNRYTFVIGTAATSNANVIKVANATDVMNGSLCLQQDIDSAGALKLWKAADNDDTISFAGAATTGGGVGTRVELIDYKSGFWHAFIMSFSGGGSEATPFSASVN